jgi:hypothetical protein
MAKTQNDQAQAEQPKEEAETPRQLDVKYHQVFPFQERQMSEQDWLQLGAKDGRLVSWNSSNNWTVPRSDLDFLSDGQLRSLLEVDRDFSVVER